MTDINLTEVVAIIDKSSSMTPLISDTIGGFNGFIKQQKEGEGKTLITLVQFDNEYQLDYEAVDVNSVEDLTTKTYVPRGSTALLDAVGRTVHSVGQRLANTPEDKRPGQVIFLIITDGQENTSRKFTASKVKEMVQHQIEKYSWTFTYMGGGDLESQRDQGLSLGINAQNVYNYSLNSVGTRAVFDGVSKGVMRRKTEAASAAAAGRMYTADASASLLDEDEVAALVTEK